MIENTPAPLDVSIVVPIYNEEENLSELLRRVHEAMEPTGRSWELICVDDCSSDTSATLLEQFATTRPWLHPLYLIRNYGQSAAMQAGFDAAAGALVVTLDGD
ncbi:MAG: glycosyltransferase, partial [Sulfuricella sp.]|nr:glycosyltransferase [Sulfuricella sp.]